MSDVLAKEWRPSEQSMQTQLGNETVVMHKGTGTYFGLDEVGSQIWSLLTQKVGLSEIGAMVAKEYGVPESTVRDDMARFVENLAENDLLVLR